VFLRVHLWFHFPFRSSGKRRSGTLREANWRVEIMDAHGAHRRELPLAKAQILWLGHPDWR
jgi:hypothetical protein